MPYYSRDSLVTKLTEVETQITAAQAAESYGIGERQKRMNLKALYEERDRLVEKIEAIDRYSDGFFNKAKFERPS